MKRKWFALLILSSCLALPATAQVAQEIDSISSQSQAPTAGMDGLVEKVNIITRTKTPTELPENDPVALDLGFVDIPGVSKTLTEGVTAKAYARYVSVDDMKIGQLVLSSVGKGNRTEPLNSDNFVAQFNLDQTALDPSSPITIEGDQPELVAALERLAAAEDIPEDEKSEEEIADSGVGASEGKVGSNASSNPDASGYSTPDGLDVKKTPVISSNITTNGCKIRVDLDQLQAIQQTRVETVTDGTPEYSDCADGSERFKISPSYAVCPYDENVETMKATAQFMYYYTDGGGNREEIGDCQPDTEKVYDIVEDRNACTVYLDYINLEAVPQGKLVYTNHNGKEIPVSSCAASIEVEPVPMERTTEGCDIRDDFLAGKSFGRSKYIYTLEGQDWDTSCQDNDEEYDHSTIYKTANGDQVCEPIINRESGKVTLQSRVMINVHGFEIYRTPCTPDPSAKDIQSTTSGCQDPGKWSHNISAGQSIGSERFYYLLDGKQEPVTECQDNGVIYTHQQELTGWQRHDDKLFAYRLVTVYIEGVETLSGRYNVLTSQVLPGDPQVPYLYTGVGPATNGETYYEGCTRFDERDEVEIYKRPDETTHKVTVGEATPLDLGNKCNIKVDWAAETYKRWSAPQGYTGSVCGRTGYRVFVEQQGSDGEAKTIYPSYGDHCNYTASVGTKILEREDGTQIGDAVKGNCETVAAYPSYNQSGHSGTYQWYITYRSNNGGFPAHSYAVKAGCINQWGWY
ncbi:hypothetical protein [Thalassospira lucentensis]|uniref:hypothetical protein n=1 Tax=Thalassospira lucentensis TaxID=168935 RepID=UPI003D28C9F6|tara:strand:- start:17903 stop:20134 length:2232 start_codon:yes stop_codon:yes gene_type:complete